MKVWLTSRSFWCTFTEDILACFIFYRVRSSLRTDTRLTVKTAVMKLVLEGKEAFSAETSFPKPGKISSVQLTCVAHATVCPGFVTDSFRPLGVDFPSIWVTGLLTRSGLCILLWLGLEGPDLVFPWVLVLLLLDFQ